MRQRASRAGISRAGAVQAIGFNAHGKLQALHGCMQSQQTPPPPAVASQPDGASAAAILFLDFDGVLQTPALDDWQEMEHCAFLEALLREFPALGLVVTSTHRDGRTLADVQRLLPEAVARCVVGITEVSPNGRANGGRQAEIEAWLRDHPAVTCWVAVDDEPKLYAERCPWLVLTHPWVGWGEQTSDAVREQLSRARTRHPTMTGIDVTPSAASASHRCRPSMNAKPAPLRVSTGSAGQSLRLPLAAASNQRSKNASRSSSGKSGAASLAKAASSVVSILRTWTGLRTKS